LNFRFWFSFISDNFKSVIRVGINLGQKVCNLFLVHSHGFRWVQGSKFIHDLSFRASVERAGFRASVERTGEGSTIVDVVDRLLGSFHVETDDETEAK
jgi:hypothetical protein